MGLSRVGVWSVLAMAVFTRPVLAYDQGCVELASLRYFKAQTEYQNGLYDLIAADVPQFDGLAKLSRDLQIAMSIRQHHQIAYLLEKRPAGLVITKGIVQFVNFDWTDEDNAQWLKHDPEAAALVDKIAALAVRSNGNPQWPGLRAYFRERLSGNPQYKALGKKLDAAVSDVAAILASCG